MNCEPIRHPEKGYASAGCPHMAAGRGARTALTRKLKYSNGLRCPPHISDSSLNGLVLRVHSHSHSRCWIYRANANPKGDTRCLNETPW